MAPSKPTLILNIEDLVCPHCKRWFYVEVERVVTTLGQAAKIEVWISLEKAKQKRLEDTEE